MSYFARSDELPAWVGDLPDDWKRDWLKWSVRLSTERPTEEEQAQLPYISNEDIASWTGKLMNDQPRPAESDGRKFQVDDVLLNKLRPYLAKVYHADFDGVSSGELLCLRPSNIVLPRFLFYVLVSKGFIDSIDAETFGSKMPRADWEIVGHQPLPLPSLETQRRIAQFLDEKTARIDGLIEKKRALLDRLAEKRQALITRAVTKGLNPDAPMKPSGIDWLGDIPAHWEVFLAVCRINGAQRSDTALALNYP
jgi:type I restriction enzyme S subunit